MEAVFQPLVAIEPATLIVTILNLFLQLFLLKKFLLDKVFAVLDQRREAADRQINDAQEAHDEAMRIKQTYETNMLQAKAQAEQLLERANKTAIERSEAIVGQAKQEAAQIKNKAAADIAQQKVKALNDAKDEISHVAMAIAEKVVERQLEPEDQTKLIDDFINNLGDAL